MHMRLVVTYHEQLQQQHQQKQHGLVDVALISPPPPPPLPPALLAPSPSSAAAPLLEYWGLSTLSTAAVGDWQAFCGGTMSVIHRVESNSVHNADH